VKVQVTFTIQQAMNARGGVSCALSLTSVPDGVGC